MKRILLIAMMFLGTGCATTSPKEVAKPVKVVEKEVSEPEKEMGACDPAEALIDEVNEKYREQGYKFKLEHCVETEFDLGYIVYSVRIVKGPDKDKGVVHAMLLLSKEKGEWKVAGQEIIFQAGEPAEKPHTL